MSEVPFHRTPMGRTYYDHTLPKLVRELERLNANLEKLAAIAAERSSNPEQADPDSESSDEGPR